MGRRLRRERNKEREERSLHFASANGAAASVGMTALEAVQKTPPLRSGNGCVAVQGKERAQHVVPLRGGE